MLQFLSRDRDFCTLALDFRTLGTLYLGSLLTSGKNS